MHLRPVGYEISPSPKKLGRSHQGHPLRRNLSNISAHIRRIFDFLPTFHCVLHHCSVSCEGALGTDRLLAVSLLSPDHLGAGSSLSGSPPSCTLRRPSLSSSGDHHETEISVRIAMGGSNIATLGQMCSDRTQRMNVIQKNSAPPRSEQGKSIWTFGIEGTESC